MPAFIQRLELLSGKTIKFGEPWPGDVDGVDVGLIEEVDEVASQYADGTMQTQPAHYRVWLLPPFLVAEIIDYFRKVQNKERPDKIVLGQALNKVPQVTRRRVWASQVAVVEEVASMPEVWPEIQEYYEDQLGLSNGAAQPEPFMSASP